MMMKALASRTFAYVILALLALSGTASPIEPDGNGVSFSDDETLRLGERIYRDGVLPSGEPVQAVVEGDIPVDGTMFTCVSCHLRSGLGSVEGTVITPPTNGASLYVPYSRFDLIQYLPGGSEPIYPAWTKSSEAKEKGEIRTAYTDESLAEVLRTGINPSGKKLDDIMPIYMLSDRDVELLIQYLKNLSPRIDPGVTESEIRLATVITEGVNEGDRDAMLLTLKTVIADHSAQHRGQEKRGKRGTFYKKHMWSPYRKLTLTVWELKGPPGSWKNQLEQYYEAEPVFALIGGIAEGSWQPIHDFCEQHEIPSLFPITDLPNVDEDDWYTVYFSKGLYQEGESAARYLRSIKKVSQDTRIVQVFRRERNQNSIAEGFRETGKKMGLDVSDYALDMDVKLTDKVLEELVSSDNPTVILLWLDRDEIAVLESLRELKHKPESVFVSSTLMGDDLSIIPEAIRNLVFITYPYSMPDDKTENIFLVKRWLKIRKIPVTNFTIQAKMYFLNWVLSEVLMHLQDDFYRDYFLDELDMMDDETYSIAVYPRLSFGPGQRHASKGCYVVQLSEGPEPKLVKRSDWIIH